MDSRFVIAAFKPKPGMEAKLKAIVEKHWDILQTQGLVTDRPCYAMQGEDGTILEVFEWKSETAIEQAHHNPVVLALWKEYESACEYLPLAALPESKQPFPNFRPLPT